jgi:hypothetical protein
MSCRSACGSIFWRGGGGVSRQLQEHARPTFIRLLVMTPKPIQCFMPSAPCSGSGLVGDVASKGGSLYRQMAAILSILKEDV